MNPRNSIVVLLLAGSLGVVPASAQRFHLFPPQNRQDQQRQQDHRRDERRDRRDQGARQNPPPAPPDSGRNQPRGQDDQHRENRGPWWGRPQNAPGPRSGEWLQQHLNQSVQDQEKALEQDPNFRRLAPDRQERLRERLRNFNNLPPDQRERVLQRMQAFDRLSPEQKQRAHNLFQRFRGLPLGRRMMLNQALRNLRDTSPQERQRILDSPSYRSAFSDDERDILRGMSDMGIGPGQHPDQGPDEGPGF